VRAGDDAHIVPSGCNIQHIFDEDAISVVGSLISTTVTVPTSLPSWMIGLPFTPMSSRGQKNFVFFCGFYAFFWVKGRFLQTLTAVLKLT